MLELLSSQSSSPVLGVPSGPQMVQPSLSASTVSSRMELQLLSMPSQNSGALGEMVSSSSTQSPSHALRPSPSTSI